MHRLSIVYHQSQDISNDRKLLHCDFAHEPQLTCRSAVAIRPGVFVAAPVIPTISVMIEGIGERPSLFVVGGYNQEPTNMLMIPVNNGVLCKVVFQLHVLLQS